MNRRTVITLFGGAATWPLAAHAQQAVQVVGYLDASSPGASAPRVAVFRRGPTPGDSASAANEIFVP